MPARPHAGQEPGASCTCATLICLKIVGTKQACQSLLLVTLPQLCKRPLVRLPMLASRDGVGHIVTVIGKCRLALALAPASGHAQASAAGSS